MRLILMIIFSTLLSQVLAEEQIIKFDPGRRACRGIQSDIFIMVETSTVIGTSNLAHPTIYSVSETNISQRKQYALYQKQQK
uniref:Uncharacterized protein n=1 Tax=Ciona intestinalis TaxID=7719 RepID=H2XP54_CIOIN